MRYDKDIEQLPAYACRGGAIYGGGFDSPEVREDYNSKISGRYKPGSSIDILLQNISYPQDAYKKPEARFYTPGQSGDFSLNEYERGTKGYGVNSDLSGQYGMKGAKNKYILQ